MADRATTELIERIIVEKVRGDEMFTAYDITVEARAQGAQIRHGEARDIVHDVFRRHVMGPRYQRSVIDLGQSARPFVYHPTGSDPSTYRSSGTGASAAASAPDATRPSSPRPSKRGFFGKIFDALTGGGDSGRSSVGRTPRQPDTSRSTPAKPSSQPRRREDFVLDLNAKAFLPINRDELLSSAKNLNVWASPWFGRRDLIPPIDDPRTGLIDRGMIAEGFLSPEELKRIHEVGAEMEYYRPAETMIRHQANRAGQAAVEEDRRERAKRKAQKKAEAEERRKLRRQEIEHRRATQIDFLGRAVSSKLNQCESDIEKLARFNLPILHSPTDLAQQMGIDVSRLRWLSFHVDVAAKIHYVYFQIPKKSGGTRQLSAPLPRLAAAQKWIYTQLLQDLPVADCAHGFVRGRSISTGALPHVNQHVLLNMDLEDFFPSIGFARVRHAFQWLGYSPAVATVLALLCTEAPRRKVTFKGATYYVATGPRTLPQGACTSPAISNLVAAKLDRRIQGLANKLNLTYTRYADDLTLSGDEVFESKLAYAMACMRHIADDEGFKVKTSKTRVLRRSTAQSVTGLIVNEKLGVGRKKLRRIRAILHNARRTGLAKQNRDQHPNFRAALEGNIAFIAMTRPDLATKLRSQLDSIPD